jgi:allantoin racemase
MKLWYQSMSRDGENDVYSRTLHEIFERVKDPGTEIELHKMSKGGGGGQYRYLGHLETNEVLDNVNRAQSEGFDAILLGNITDPGLDIAREISAVPVVGLCEASLYLACLMGKSFSLVTANEKYSLRVHESVARAGLKDRLVAIDYLPFERTRDMLRGWEDPEARNGVVAAFNKAARRGIEAGAEVVIAGGGGVMAMLELCGVHTTEQGIPILNGITSLVKMGEMAAKMQKLMGGNFTSRRLAYAMPPLKQIAELRRNYGADIYPTLPKD